MKKLRTKIIAAGATKPTRIRVEVDTVSTVSGKEILGSVILKGRRFGTIREKAAPTAAIALQSVSLVMSIFAEWPVQRSYTITIQSIMYEIMSLTDTELCATFISAIAFTACHSDQVERIGEITVNCLSE